MKVNISYIAYKLWVFLFMPCWWLSILIDYFNESNYKPEPFLLVIAILLIIANYLTYIKNRIMYWLGYVLIFIFSGSVIGFLPNFITFNMRWIAVNLFSSYESLTTFTMYLGMIFLFSYFYFWAGLGSLFNTYTNFGFPTKNESGMKVKIPNLLQNPIIIGALIIGVAGVIGVAYYRYTDPYNQCQRALKERNPSANKIWVLQQCNKIISGKGNFY
ncbi:hypothetical protein BKG95_02245 [Rodentibacter pneumotropicus]|uniref:Transmembrane protein n=1 Tax=Rodentibacter pneumotropicus TaxID=758 RepID=A0AAW5LBA1_9PAST|nr:hypothetical protein [Rodentibacter pneumotropicus]MCQ9120934.1 hypothetical protein [Rodentibacter pneumotropicus]OOF69105.1 hypothetical protein BKG95_02245 [Rodentibacter pneumotropicus]